RITLNRFIKGRIFGQVNSVRRMCRHVITDFIIEPKPWDLVFINSERNYNWRINSLRDPVITPVIIIFIKLIDIKIDY
ncbi:MAG: hypothetical protein ACTSXF_15220, partial [Promethearchaeota archaeon]